MSRRKVIRLPKPVKAALNPEIVNIALINLF